MIRLTLINGINLKEKTLIFLMACMPLPVAVGMISLTGCAENSSPNKKDPGAIAGHRGLS